MVIDRVIGIGITQRLVKNSTSTTVYGFASLACYSKERIRRQNHFQVTFNIRYTG